MYKRILVPLDGSRPAEQALSHAVGQAKCSDGEVILLRVLEPLPRDRGLPRSAIQDAEAKTAEIAREYLEQIAAGIREQGIEVRAAAIDGRPRQDILRFAAENEADLIVMCTCGHHAAAPWSLGSTAERIVQGSRIPVLLIQPARGAEERGGT